MAFMKTGAPEKQKPVIDESEQIEHYCMGFEDTDESEAEDEDETETADSG